MKAILVRERTSLQTSIELDGSEYDYFYNPLHYHPELELTLVIKSFGQRRVGDHIENFGPGDLVLLGPNVLHVWKNDEIFLKEDAKIKAQAIVVKFLPEFAGTDIMERPEMKKIHQLITQTSLSGIKLTGKLRDRVEQIILGLPSLDDTGRFIGLLEILYTISNSQDFELLASSNFQNEKEANTHRINVILDYIMDNYQEDLSLELVASQINMNKNAFCRFFKKSTRKSLITMINEVRISKACQNLVETEMDILQVCYACGFNNISNFNKAFKKLKGISPRAYRKKNLNLSS